MAVAKLIMLWLMAYAFQPTAVVGRAAAGKNVWLLGFASYQDQDPKCISYYYLNENTAKWSEANIYCKRKYGVHKASLVNIETDKERRKISSLLPYNGALYYCWTEGAWDTKKESFNWGNGLSFQSMPTWGDGFPNGNDSTTRVALANEDGKSFLQTHDESVSLMFICEQKVCTPSFLYRGLKYDNGIVCDE